MIEHQVDSALAEYEEVCSEAAGAGVDLVSKVDLIVMVTIVEIVMMVMMMMMMMMVMVIP